MNIWLSFVPGSAASTIELILRSCTDLDCLKIVQKSSPKSSIPIGEGFSIDNSAITSHVYVKQWHPLNKKDLFAKKYTKAQDNIFTPIVPMSGIKTAELLEYINSQSGIKFYLGPCNFKSAEFASIALQKVPNFYINDIPSFANKSFNEVQKLEKWELRELISLTFFEWWFPESQEQWNLAEQLGFTCIDTMDIFKNFKEKMLFIIQKIGCNITDIEKFNRLCDIWSQGQDKIWKDWENYVKYKQDDFSVISSECVLQEAMIQWNLRQQGIELKCYGLNTFPNSEELKQYYE